MLSRVIRRAFCQNPAVVFSNKPLLELDVDDLHSKTIWRLNNSGIKELDLLAGSFANEKLRSFKGEELVQFNKDVVWLGSTLLYQMILGQVAVPEGNKYVPMLIEYAKTQKQKL